MLRGASQHSPEHLSYHGGVSEACWNTIKIVFLPTPPVPNIPLKYYTFEKCQSCGFIFGEIITEK